MAIVIFAMLLVWLGICLALTAIAARAMRRHRRPAPAVIPLEIVPTQRRSA